MSASSPWTVLSSVKHASWQVARASPENAKQATASGMSSNANERCQGFTEYLDGRVVVFICAEDCKTLARLSSSIAESVCNECGGFLRCERCTFTKSARA